MAGCGMRRPGNRPGTPARMRKLVCGPCHGGASVVEQRLTGVAWTGSEGVRKAVLTGIPAAGSQQLFLSCQNGLVCIWRRELWDERCQRPELYCMF